MFLLVLILIWCSVFGFWTWLKPRRPSPPVFPGALPIIGHGYLMFGDHLHMWRTERDLYNFSLNNGGIVVLLLGPVPLYVVTDLDDSLLISNTCLEKPYLYNFGKELYNRGLITASASTWKADRKVLNPAFNQHIRNALVGEYVTHGKSLVSDLASKVGTGPFDMTPYLVKNLLRAVYKTTLGIKPNDHEEEVAVKNYSDATDHYFDLIEDRFQRIWLHPPFIFNRTSMKKKQDELTKILKNITGSLISKRRADLEKRIHSTEDQTSDNFKTLLDIMLEMTRKEDIFTDDDIREHLDTVIAAGYDSTTKAMMFILLLIGSHPEVQDKIYEELLKVFGEHDRDLTRHDLPKLVYLEAVMKESMRLFPPVPRVGKCGHTELKLKNYTLPPGSVYVISVYGINRHPIWGADADQFRPERWLDPATLPDNPNAFASFSIGKRNCIGKQYSLMSMKTMLAYLLRSYRFTSDINNLQSKCDINLKPVSGHHMSLELRTKQEHLMLGGGTGAL